MIELTDVTKTYPGDAHALAGVTLSIRPGELVEAGPGHARTHDRELAGGLGRQVHMRDGRVVARGLAEPREQVSQQ